jgi:S1-C subfamily serine protease
MASTRKNKPGDEVEVVVLRDGKEITLRVTLSSAR